MNNLIRIDSNEAIGNTSILCIDSDKNIVRRNGNNENLVLMFYINNSLSFQERLIQMNWFNAKIKEFTANSTWLQRNQLEKRVKI